MKEVEAKEMAQTLIGQTIVGIVINYERETVTLELSNNDLEFGGDGLSMKCFDLTRPLMN
jgi:hypothetical protein